MRRIPAVIASLAVFAGVALSGPGASASHGVQFGRIQYNSPGADTRTNASLNAEYVVIVNHSYYRRCLTNWTVRDAAGIVYTFGTLCLSARESVTLHTGKGSNTASHRYWGRTNYVWNNAGDTARLRNGSGTPTDSCAWTSAGTGYKIC